MVVTVPFGQPQQSRYCSIKVETGRRLFLYVPKLLDFNRPAGGLNMAIFDRLVMHWYHHFWKKHLLKRLINPPKRITVCGLNEVDGPSVSIGEDCRLGVGVFFRGKRTGKIKIGSSVLFGDNDCVNCAGEIVIGDRTMIAANTFITDLDHGCQKGSPMSTQPLSISKVTIGSDVWIGNGVTILKGSVIHDGAVIGAGAVVKGEIPENAIAVGVPAKVIKYRQ